MIFKTKCIGILLREGILNYNKQLEKLVLKVNTKGECES
jgi:hypothetical protein